MVGDTELTFIPPSLGKLKPNPDWAALPLFDRTGWKRVRFGEVVEGKASELLGLETARPRDEHPPRQ